MQSKLQIENIFRITSDTIIIYMIYELYTRGKITGENCLIYDVLFCSFDIKLKIHDGNRMKCKK